MIDEIEKVNMNMKENENIIIGSLDIVKWYPSMKLKRIIEIVKTLMMETHLNL